MTVCELKTILEQREKDGKGNQEIMFEDDFGFQYFIGRTYEFDDNFMLVQKDFEYEE